MAPLGAVPFGVLPLPLPPPLLPPLPLGGFRVCLGFPLADVLRVPPEVREDPLPLEEYLFDPLRPEEREVLLLPAELLEGRR